jgi:hypothetical protein
MIYPFGISAAQAGLFISHKSIVTARGAITKQFRRIFGAWLACTRGWPKPLVLRGF